jgi:hypothetical protein
MKKALIIWAIIMVVFYAVLSGVHYPDAGNNVLGLAVISLVVMLIMLNKHWKGEIVQIKTEAKHYADDDGPGETVDIEYAYVKLANGKTKKIRNMAWKVGDKLEKKRGQFKPQLIS